MMTLNRLAQLAATCQYQRLLDEVMANGRRMTVSARMRLQEADAIAPAALGLALRRAVELSYRAQPGSRAIAAQLLALQGEDGSFGNAASTSIACAGLLALADQAALWGNPALAGSASQAAARSIGTEAEQTLALRRAADAAMNWLADAQQQTLVTNPRSAWAGLIVNPVDTALVLWQLGSDERFRSRVDYHALINAVATAGLMHDRRCRALLVASATVEDQAFDTLFSRLAEAGEPTEATRRSVAGDGVRTSGGWRRESALQPMARAS